jgi:dephospho-CoA kinase
MTVLLGLTGSIGMGKTTTAGFFQQEGIPVWDADAAVHRLYSKDGGAVGAIGQICPQAIEEQRVSRETLKREILNNPDLLHQIESIVHPLVGQDRQRFIAAQTADIILLDIPLLFETGIEATLDATLLVTAPPDLQRKRVLDRPGMTEETFNLILSRQMPDADKRSRATHIVETLAIDQTQAYVRALIQHLRQSHA